jgi:hypothetical protein
VPGQQRGDALKVKRWGIRLIAFLGLGFVALLISSLQGHYTMLSFAILMIAFLGAGYSTVRGLVTLYAIPPDQRTRGRSQQD